MLSASDCMQEQKPAELGAARGYRDQPDLLSFVFSQQSDASSPS